MSSTRLAVRRAARLCAGLALAACSGSGGTPDRELPGLVVAAAPADPTIDLARAARDARALVRAVSAPHRAVAEALGAHEVKAQSRVDVAEGATAVESLTTDVALVHTASGEYHARLDNSADYGREIIYTGGALYLRPRYGKWHRRAPNDDAEPALRETEIYGELAGHLELLAPAIEVSDRGATTEAGRPARTIGIKLAASPAKPPPQTVKQRGWRDTAVVEAASGEVVLDAASGVPLRAAITGQVAFARDGRRFTMKLDVRQTVIPLATPPTIAAPPAEEVVATPERLREVEERDFLLEGMAPRQQKSPTGPRPAAEAPATPAAPAAPGADAPAGGGKQGP